MIVSWYERENRKVLSRCLKTASDGADTTCRGRSFQTVAPETAGVMCSDRRILKVSRAAEFWADGRRWMRLAGSPNRILLQ